MTYIVKDECIKCKLTDCVEVCPVDCYNEGENMLVIHLALSQIGNVRVVLVQNIKIRVIILELLVLNITNVLKASMDPLM